MNENTEDQSTLICRGCLSECGEMKNMYEWGLDVDFFRYTDISREPSEGLPVLLCTDCEADLKRTKDFTDRCRRSNKILKRNLKMLSNEEKSSKNNISSFLLKNKVILMITAPNEDEKINLPCPYDCDNEFSKKSLLSTHLIKSHNVPKNFEIDLQYYCYVEGCVYSLNSTPKKYFSGRKFLNQHYIKSHKEKIYLCDKCRTRFSRECDLDRHLRSCSMIYVCSVCTKQYNSNESYLVHIKRRHPNFHAKFKLNKKINKPNDNPNAKDIEISLKRKQLDTDNDKYVKRINKSADVLKNQKPKTVLKSNLNNFTPEVNNTQQMSNILSCNNHNVDIDIIKSEKVITDEKINTEKANNNKNKKLTTNDKDSNINEQSLTPWFVEECMIQEYNENTNNGKNTSTIQIQKTISDETLNSWTNKTDFVMQTDGIATQTVLDEILSLKPQNNEDETFSPESVSDIETQTFPFEFQLNKCNKETQFSTCLAPDLSFKETQTCVCFCPNSRSNCRHYGCPISSHSNFNVISTETQTGEYKRLINTDVMLSFSSAETQTCFEDSNDII